MVLRSTYIIEKLEWFYNSRSYKVQDYEITTDQFTRTGYQKVQTRQERDTGTLGIIGRLKKVTDKWKLF